MSRNRAALFGVAANAVSAADERYIGFEALTVNRFCQKKV